MEQAVVRDSLKRRRGAFAMVKMLRAGVLIAALGIASSVNGAQAQEPTRTPIPPASKDFAADAVQASQYEIEAAWVALAQSRTPDVRAFAHEMIKDHTRAQASMREAANASGLQAPPPAMSSEEASLLSALQGARGSDFDKLYARQQVLAHTEALAVEQSYAAQGADNTLRRAAQADVPMVQHHLGEARALAAALQ